MYLFIYYVDRRVSVSLCNDYSEIALEMSVFRFELLVCLVIVGNGVSMAYRVFKLVMFSFNFIYGI